MLAEVADARGIDPRWPDTSSHFVFPLAIYPVPGDLRCEGCGDLVASAVEATCSDAAALDQIARWMCAPEWPVSGLEDIAEIVRASGRTIGDDPDADWPRH